MSPTWIVFRKEWLEVIRDRRAIFVAFVLPVLIYPALYYAVRSTSIGDRDRSTLRVGVGGDSDFLRPYLDGRRLILEPGEFDPQRLRDGSFALFAQCDPSGVTVHFLTTSHGSTEALHRFREALGACRDDRIRGRFAAMGRSLDPRRVASIELHDLSSAETRSLFMLGKLLPVFLVILLLAGGSFAAIDLIAGEKERGTLETLFLQPIDRSSLVRGKFLVVLFMSFASLASNAAGLLVTWKVAPLLGFERSDGPIDGFVLPPLRVYLLVLLWVLPLAVFTSSLLLAISAYARSFREAQTYLVPVTLVGVALVLLGAAPGASLASVLALVPVTNAALAIRDVLEGRFQVLPQAIAWAASATYAAMALRRARSLLLREDLVLGIEPPAVFVEADLRARRAVLAVALHLLLFYFVGSWAQAQDLVLGLVFSLWCVVLLPPIVYLRARGSPLRKTLGLVATPARNLLLALPVAAALAVLITAYKSVQDQFLPVPLKVEEYFKELLDAQGLTDTGRLLLFAISPAICEEILFRGALQGELEPQRRPWRTVLIVGFFFGLFHLSVHRLVPTALVGCVLAITRQRSGSIFPAMATHASYNALVLFGLERIAARGGGDLVVHPLLVAAALGVLAAALAGMGRSQLRSGSGDG